ncbi:hypothetical protein [Pseudomonas protegens]|uniref:hypothetical protein n=1 Tax=Pseudomonas protegens TaxID=380021 RepID=UPI0021558F74|nr:hypothetical protein [Pseudomonas protegens]
MQAKLQRRFAGAGRRSLMQLPGQLPQRRRCAAEFARTAQAITELAQVLPAQVPGVAIAHPAARAAEDAEQIGELIVGNADGASPQQAKVQVREQWGDSRIEKEALFLASGIEAVHLYVLRE